MRAAPALSNPLPVESHQVDRTAMRDYTTGSMIVEHTDTPPEVKERLRKIVDAWRGRDTEVST